MNQRKEKQNGFISERIVGNQIEMTFMSSHLEDGFARWYIMFADYAEIVEPEILKTRLKEIMKNAAERL